jgi:hypothetical protein
LFRLVLSFGAHNICFFLNFVASIMSAPAAAAPPLRRFSDLRVLIDAALQHAQQYQDQGRGQDGEEDEDEDQDQDEDQDRYQGQDRYRDQGRGGGYMPRGRYDDDDDDEDDDWPRLQPPPQLVRRIWPPPDLVNATP